MASNFTVTQLSDFLKEVSSTIIGNAYFSSDYIQYFDVMEGVKGKQKLNYYENTLGLSVDSCGWVGSGMATEFTQREIDVKELKSEGAFCLKDLERVWLGQLMKRGTTQTDFPFEQLIFEDMKIGFKKVVENLMFRGVWSGSTGTYLDLADGLIQVLSDESGSTISGSTTGTTTVLNVASKIDEICTLFPNAIKDKELIIMTSLSNYTLYVKALYNANLYHYVGEISKSFSIQVPWMPNVKVIGIEAITGDDYIASVSGNFILACDSREEMQEIQVWNEMKDETLNTRLHFKFGVQVYHPEYVVVNGI